MVRAVHSSYDSTSGTWLRGNLHAHSTNSDGEKTPPGLIQTYREMGYDWFCISDHDFLTPRPEALPHDAVFLPANEVSANGPHILHVGADRVLDPDPDRASVARKIADSGGLCILNHPNWGKDCNHWPQEGLESMPRYDGIEVYNAVIRRLEGSPLATDRWDRLLSQGIRVWGYANDDAHRRGDYGHAWNAVSSVNRQPDGVLQGL